MSKLSKNETKKISTISSYISKNFKSDRDKIRAIFYFCTHHIKYDIENMYKINFNENSEMKVKKALELGLGVCSNYSEVFQKLAEAQRIEAYIITGITKQDGKNNPYSHSWNSAKIEGKWYLFDATWGAGVISNDRFIYKLDNQYFMSSSFQKSHYPFDYIWQLNNSPISANDFLESKPNSNTKNCQYDTIISKLRYLSEIDQMKESIYRIEEETTKNELIKERLRFLKSYIATFEFNEAVMEYNTTINLFNVYVKYKNKQFKPEISDHELESKINLLKSSIMKAKKKISEMKYFNDLNQANLTQFRKAILDTEKSINEQVQFVQTYISKSPELRKSMFYKKVKN